MLSNHIAKELTRCYTKGTLAMVEFHVLSCKDLEHLAKMIKVLIRVERLDKHVIYVYFHGVAEFVGEHLVD